MCLLSIKVPIRKKSGNLLNFPRTNLMQNEGKLFLRLMAQNIPGGLICRIEV